MRLLKGLVIAASLLICAVAVGQRAEASTLNFAVTGDSTFNWTLDSNPTPTGLGSGVVYFSGVSGVPAGYNLLFFTSALSGGLEISTRPISSASTLLSLAGQVVFTGSVNSPQFAPGIYHFSLNGGGGATDTTLTITATPIPAALPLFASALAGLGFAGWHRKGATAA